MKKIFSLIAISTLIIAGFSACGEEDATYTPTASSINIVKADVFFDCLGGEGVIEVEDASNVSFSCDSAWVSLSQNKTTGAIAVSVSKNYSIESRTALVSLSDGKTVKDVVVLQQGICKDYSPKISLNGKPSVAVVEGEEYSALWIESNEAATYAFGCTSLEPIEILDQDDWFTVEFANDSLYITVEPNTTGHLRQGFLAYECGALRDEMIISQYDLNENIYGPAVLQYTAYVKGQFLDSTLVVNVTENGIELPAKVTKSKDGNPWYIPMKNEKNTLNFSLSNKSYVGDYAGKYNLNLIALDETGATTFANVTYETIPFYEEEYNLTYLPVVLDTEWYGFIFGAYAKDAEVNADNIKAATDYFLQATLLIFPAETSVSTASSYRNIDVPTLRAKRPKKK